MKNLFFIKRQLLIISLSFCFVLTGFATELHEEDNRRNTNQSRSTPNRLTGFIRDRICGLYYTTSVTGHNSDIHPVSEFLKNELKEGWSLNEVTFKKESFPCRNDEDYKKYDRILNETLPFLRGGLEIREDQSERDFELINDISTYQYLVRSEELKKCLFSRDYMDFSVY